VANDHLLGKQVLSQLSCTPLSWLLQFIVYHLRCNFNRSQTRKSRNTRNNIGFRNGEAIGDSLAYRSPYGINTSSHNSYWAVHEFEAPTLALNWCVYDIRPNRRRNSLKHLLDRAPDESSRQKISNTIAFVEEMKRQKLESSQPYAISIRNLK
jgi:hypothetical protein